MNRDCRAGCTPSAIFPKATIHYIHTLHIEVTVSIKKYCCSMKPPPRPSKRRFSVRGRRGERAAKSSQSPLFSIVGSWSVVVVVTRVALGRLPTRFWVHGRSGRHWKRDAPSLSGAEREREKVGLKVFLSPENCGGWRQSSSPTSVRR